jgi:branched-subunit amino acid ABC-type transport system permease component/ABC-type branched-subunit amino acid transport system substrate-binding protein
VSAARLTRAALRFLLAMATLVAFGACARARDPDDVVIGAYLSLTGADSTFGADTRLGIELAFEQVNAGGGVRGKHARLVVADDKSLPGETTQKVQELIDREKVIAILGEVASSRSMVGGLLANAKKVPMVTPSSTAVDVTKGRPYVFRTCFTDAQQGEAAARFVFERQHKTRVGILYTAQDTYASGLANRFAQSFEALGGHVVAVKAYQLGETNYTTYLRELWAAKPEAIFAPVYYKDMVPIARQAKSEGIPGSIFVGGDAWDSDDLLSGAGAELEGSFFTNHYAPDVPWENSRAFHDAYVARYGREPGSIGAQGYDAARLLLDAVVRATSLDRDAVRDALAATKDFRGATGTISIDAHHNANKPVVIVEVRGGGFHYSEQLSASPDEGVPIAHVLEEPQAAAGAASVPQALLTGLAQGAMIALIALGYTMVFGVLKMINFAHSEVFMMAAYVGLFAITACFGASHGAYPILAVAVGVVASTLAAALLGVTIERAAYRPLRIRARGSRLGRVTPLVTALGMSVVLQNVAQLLFTARFRSYPQLLPSTRPVIVIVALVVMIALEVLVRFTWFGKAMRAVSANEPAARLMGINSSRVIATTFAVGSMLAAVGAVLFCLDQSQVYPTMGFKIGTQAFVAAVLGGIGRISGAMLGGLLIGILGELLKLTSYSGGVDVLVFLVLIAVLLVRPTGLLGARVAEKV